ncbi:MAG: hypothetical protein LBI31_00345 [Zoogloeaceae bacterium]|jgi:hypothetical protein|nr:hypothetical protein [Zoogloeaceae bacterium]
MNGKTLVLNLDDSGGGLPGSMEIDLSEWQEAIRFGCSWRVWRDFRASLEPGLPKEHGFVLLGSGDFHHVSFMLIERQRAREGLHVLVCDNHPDNMRFPFGIHCGSWVSHVADLPHVARIDVVGIHSPDVGWRRAWENRLGPLYRGRLRYWTIGAKTGWLRALGLRDAARNFGDAKSLVSALRRELSATDAPLYLSIDKDVLHERVARTNWDQGSFTLDDLLGVVAAARPRLVGGDITGEVSVYRYRARWKRLLSALDAQPAIAPDDLILWRRQQLEVNRALLEAIVA